MIPYEDALEEVAALDAYEAAHPQCEVCHEYGALCTTGGSCFCGLPRMVHAEPDQTPVHAGDCAIEWELGKLPTWAMEVARAVAEVRP